MINYNDLYEILRKEKYSDSLQALSKNFILEYMEYLNDKKKEGLSEDSMFAESTLKSRKQLENSVAMFNDFIRIRKKKILNLAFIATETGIMKRDYENMLSFEKDTFDKLVKAFEDSDRELSKQMNGKKGEIVDNNKMVIFLDNIESFVDMEGNSIGPFNKGQLANLDGQICELFVSSGKARYVDEN